MTNVAVTGAAGRIGTQLLPGLDDHYVTAIDLDPVSNPGLSDFAAREADITADSEALQAAFDGAEVVVHLAARAASESPWPAVLGTNIDGTYRVYEAAAAAGVDRVVFASSNHVVHGHNIAQPSQPDTLVERPRTVTPSDPVAPSGPYGVSKVAGEAIGSIFAKDHPIEVVNLRIGAMRTPDQLHAMQEKQPAVARYHRAMFLSPRDLRDAVRKTITASLPENPLTVNLTSRNQDRYLSITETMRTLGYRPRDDSAEVLA